MGIHIDKRPDRTPMGAARKIMNEVRAGTGGAYGGDFL